MPPLVIAHRGASGDRPEHTLEAYRLAIRQGADIIEPDLVATADGVLVARHEPELSATTDVATRPEFAGRHTSKLVDGAPVEGWFVEDFTLAELRTLRCREPRPDLRPESARWDGRLPIPTFGEVLELAARAARAGRPVGVYPETKHPARSRALGLPLEEPLADALAGHPEVPLWIQSFDPDSLARLRRLTGARLVRLLGPDASIELDALRASVDGIGAHRDLVIPRDARDRLGSPSTLVAEAHACGLFVHAWTFRAEPPFLPRDTTFEAELTAVAEAGVDGVFTDHPGRAVRLWRGVSPASGS